MAKKKQDKPRAVYELTHLPDDYYRAAVEKANQAPHQRHSDGTEYTENTRVSLWIQDLLSGVTHGATAWDIIKCLPRRELKNEDTIPEYAQDGVSLMKNRSRAEGTISAMLSHMELDGIVRWRNYGKLNDQYGNHIAGGECRHGGYGVMRRVYELVPFDERDDAAKKMLERKAAEYARRLFIKHGEHALMLALGEAEKAQAMVKRLRDEQDIIRNHFDFPEWLLIPADWEAVS